MFWASGDENPMSTLEYILYFNEILQKTYVLALACVCVCMSVY